MAKGRIYISGEKIGYQFNQNSMGERKATLVVHEENGINFVKFQGMKLEVRIAQDACGVIMWFDKDDKEIPCYNAVRQIPEVVAVETTGEEDEIVEAYPITPCEAMECKAEYNVVDADKNCTEWTLEPAVRFHDRGVIMVAKMIDAKQEKEDDP